MAEEHAWWRELGLPSREDMELPTLAWILKQSEYIYHTDELKTHLTQHFKLNNEQVLAKSDKGKAVWPNHIDWQTANWTSERRHKRLGTKRYRLTDLGLQKARQLGLKTG